MYVHHKGSLVEALKGQCHLLYMCIIEMSPLCWCKHYFTNKLCEIHPILTTGVIKDVYIPEHEGCTTTNQSQTVTFINIQAC